MYYNRKRDLAARRSMIQQKTRELGAEHAEVLSARDWYGIALCGDHQFAKAEAEYRSILQIHERVDGPNNGSVLECRNTVAIICMMQDKYAQAEVLYRAILKTGEPLDGTQTELTLIHVDAFAYCLMKQGKREEAIFYAQRAVDGYRKLVEEDRRASSDAKRELNNAEIVLKDLQRKK